MSNRAPDYADLDLDFNVNPGTGDIAKKKGPEAVKRSIRNLVYTNFYERPFQSNIGSSALKLLFEPITPLTRIMLEKFIAEVINNFEPRATLQQVIVDVTPDENAYVATVVFFVNNRPEPIVTQLFLERLR